jgi:epoxyqueuosine reductase QueG
MNISTISIEPTFSDDELDDEYYKTLRADVSHKMVATRAGLGWIGKTDLFISKKFGPRLRLATILTDYPLDCVNVPIDESRCGKCTLCVDKCPAQAANGIPWNIHVAREEFYNPFKCREKCLELSWQNMKQHISICGICVSVCPLGKPKA